MPQFQNVKPLRDSLIGLVVALISIPISMGYSQIAGLPPVYGLYGSVLPILVFGLVTTSPRFVFGVDAAPAALVGAILVTLKITPESPEAIAAVPVITLITAGWLLLFWLFKANTLLKYISSPVMGGFITGISTTIILMQLPKLFGGSAGAGEGLELFAHIAEQLSLFHPLSFALGAGTLLLILVSKKLDPRIPTSVILMLLGALASRLFNLQQYGVKLLPAVAAGLPLPKLPDALLLRQLFRRLVMPCLTVALVITSETLLATNNLGLAHDDKIQPRQELLAYALGNFSSALFGCLPVNGSISRSGIADQFGVSSQLMSIVAGLAMLGILFFGTGFIAWLPVPVLTGIVISALIGTLEFHLASKLRKADWKEWFIFYAAFFAVLLFGTVYGVAVGVALSAVVFIKRSSSPPSSLVGYDSVDDAFHPLDRSYGAAPIPTVVIYRFTGALFYANIDRFQEELFAAVKEDTRTVIVDSAGIGSLDVTAAERLLLISRKLADQGRRFYLAGHVGQLNDQLRAMGAGDLIYHGAVYRTIPLALEAAGIHKPYPLEAVPEEKPLPQLHLSEYEWAFGKGADKSLDAFARETAKRFLRANTVDDNESLYDEQLRFSDGYWAPADEDTFLNLLALHLEENGDPEQVDKLLDRIFAHHLELERRLIDAPDEVLTRFIRRRRARRERMKRQNPRLYERYILAQEKYFTERAWEDPELDRRIAAVKARIDREDAEKDAEAK